MSVTKNNGLEKQTTEQSYEKLLELMDKFHTAMLVTRGDEGARGRPMSIVKQDEQGRLLFITDVNSAKSNEIREDAEVVVTLQDERQYVSISGRARVFQDRQQLKKVWPVTANLWFDKGPEDPNAALIEVTPETAEYWDQSGMNGVRFLLHAAKALATGSRLPRSIESSGHAEVKMGDAPRNGPRVTPSYKD